MRTGLATNITGLYYTGENSAGQLGSWPAMVGTDAHWDVTYASTNAGIAEHLRIRVPRTSCQQFECGWLRLDPEHGSAQWIIAPGATDPNNGNSS